MTKKNTEGTNNKKVKAQSKAKSKESTKKSKKSSKSEVKDKETEVDVDIEQEDNKDQDSKVDELNASVSEWKDKYMRLNAEFDNYRKRTLKEKSDLIKIANEDLLKDILSVVDDFERGMDNIDNSEDIEALRKGVHLIHGKFSDFLKQKGVQEIDAKEKEFDLDFHEAITKIPAPSEKLKGKVVDVIEKGYSLNDKVIRYAKVVIGE